MPIPFRPIRRGIVLPYATRTVATYTSGNEISNTAGYSKLIVRLFCDARSGSTTADLKLQAYNDLTASWYDIPGASLAQISANMTSPIDLVIAPEITVVTNRAVSTVVPKRVRVSLTLAVATSFNCSVEYELVP